MYHPSTPEYSPLCQFQDIAGNPIESPFYEPKINLTINTLPINLSEPKITKAIQRKRDCGELIANLKDNINS